MKNQDHKCEPTIVDSPYRDDGTPFTTSSHKSKTHGWVHAAICKHCLKPFTFVTGDDMGFSTAVMD